MTIDRLITTLAIMALLAFTFSCAKHENYTATGPGTAGVRNFRELYAGLAAVTGVPVTNNNTLKFYNGAQTRLSLDGDVEKVSPAMLLASTALGGVFCGEFLTAEAKLAAGARAAHSMVDFTKAPSAMKDDARTGLVNGYARLFWRRDATAEEVGTMLSTMATAQAGQPDTAAQTRAMCLVTCAAMAGAIDSIRN